MVQSAVKEFLAGDRSREQAIFYISRPVLAAVKDRVFRCLTPAPQLNHYRMV